MSFTPVSTMGAACTWKDTLLAFYVCSFPSLSPLFLLSFA